MRCVLLCSALHLGKLRGCRDLLLDDIIRTVPMVRWNQTVLRAHSQNHAQSFLGAAKLQILKKQIQGWIPAMKPFYFTNEFRAPDCECQQRICCSDHFNPNSPIKKLTNFAALLSFFFGFQCDFFDDDSRDLLLVVVVVVVVEMIFRFHFFLFF